MRTFLNAVNLALSILLFSPVLSRAAIEDERSEAPYFVTNEGSKAQFPLAHTDVQAAISGDIAKVTGTQTYKNEGQQPIEATYIFRLLLVLPFTRLR